MSHHALRLVCLALVAATASSALAEPTARPNVLLITADDLGCQLSCYGEKRIETPKLDALAAAGVRFENAYVAQSSCSPSRAAMLTSMWPHQSGQYGLSHLGFSMKPGLANLPALLKAAGYQTGIVGKLHVQPDAEYPWDWLPKEKLAALPTRDVTLVAQRSREFFAQAKSTGKPFFFYVNFFDPHGPYNKQSDQVAGLPARPLKADDIRQPLPLRTPPEDGGKAITARIFNTILRADAGVGMLLDELASAGLADNTLVIFVGDNGLPIRNGKTTAYELGVHVPMIVRWPAKVKAGQVRPELVSLVDVMPTVLEAAGVNLPSGLAGQSLATLLQGKPSAWREFLFTEMNFHSPDMFRPQRTVRDARYKLILNLVPEQGQAAVELFDLSTDPDEAKNLATDPAHAKQLQRLQAALDQWRQATNDPLLDATRLKRWQAATAEWAARPKAKVGDSKQTIITAEDQAKLNH